MVQREEGDARTDNTRFVALLSTLPTPHTFLVVGSAQELSDPVSNYVSCGSSNFKFDILS